MASTKMGPAFFAAVSAARLILSVRSCSRLVVEAGQVADLTDYGAGFFGQKDLVGAAVVAIVGG